MIQRDSSETIERGFIDVIDDNDELRATLRKILESRGYAVSTHASVEEFFARFSRRAPGVIIVDMRMPVASELDLLRRCKAQGFSTPIIFVSGESTAQEAVAAMKDGAVDFLFKPVSLANLLRAVDAALARDLAGETIRDEEEKFVQRFMSLTPRERQLCPYLAREEKIKSIAAALGISEPTVKIHKARVLRKLAVASTAELALKLERHSVRLTSATATRK